MAKSSGGTRSGDPMGREHDTNYKGAIKNVGSLIEMKDKAMYKATKEAISRYHAVLGVRERNVKLADMNASVYGIQSNNGGKTESVYLNRKYFGGENASKTYVAMEKNGYAKQWSTKTNKPIAHTVTHELAHATWNSQMTGKNQVAARQEIQSAYKTWRADKQRSGYGKYASSNVNEWWAETVTRAVHGIPDKYTNIVKGIAKKYKL